MELVLVVVNVRSLHNVGSLFRTANGAGVSRIILAGITPTPTDRWGKVRQQVAKVALGAERMIPWEHAPSPTGALKRLRKDGYAILAVEQAKRSLPFHTFRAEKIKKAVVVLGNEVSGLSPAILKQASAILEIPMSGKKESLNVSVAGGIILYYLRYGG